MLKLNRSHNAYDILGLPRSATATQVRSRYRHLVRGYKKDLSPGALLDDEQFRQWTNAHLLLLSSERREYDRRLRQSRGREMPEDRLSSLPEGRRLMIQAETAFIQRKLNDAVELGKSAVKLESRNGEAYFLLGDILRERGLYPNALTMYNYAIQFDPNNRRYWQGLQEITALRDGKTLPKRLRSELRHPLHRPLWVWLVVAVVLAGMGAGMFALRGNWGGLGLLNLPVNLIYSALIGGFVLGLVLAATAVIGPFDDEMLWYQVAGFGTETAPIGIFIALPGVVFFWAAPIFYLIVALLDEHFSLSVALALGMSGLLALSFSAFVPQESQRVVQLLGGNVVFLGFMVGWLFGSIRRRIFEH
jgi:tetratricopeptide (TPR) repeat protein